MKPIKDFPHYYIDEQGNVYSDKSGNIRKLSTHRGSYNGKTGQGYEMIDLYVGNKRYKKSIHRLVAETFIPNPNNYPQVDHKDKVICNNNVDNLKWITSKDNIYQSYETMSAVRNFRECALYNNDVHVKDFQSVSEACRYANKHLGISYTSLHKYRKVGNIKVVSKV